MPKVERGLRTRISRSTATLALGLLATFSLPACASQKTETSPPPNQSETIIEKTLEIQTPTAGWTLKPVDLYRMGDKEYWAIHQLTAPDGMAAQVISSVSATIRFRHAGPGEPEVKHFVLGKTWNWNANPEVNFIDSRDPLKDALADAERIPLISD